MKTLFIITITLFFATVCFSQSKDEIRLKEIDSLILQKTKKLANLKEKKENLLKIYKENHPDIKDISSKIDDLDFEIITLKKEKQDVLERQFLNNLPDNQIELLKILIRQNQQIIELLKKNA